MFCLCILFWQDFRKWHYLTTDLKLTELVSQDPQKSTPHQSKSLKPNFFPFQVTRCATYAKNLILSHSHLPIIWWLKIPQSLKCWSRFLFLTLDTMCPQIPKLSHPQVLLGTYLWIVVSSRLTNSRIPWLSWKLTWKFRSIHQSPHFHRLG